MKLKKILKGFEKSCQSIKGVKDPEITGVCSDSRSAAPGNLFIAKSGLTNEGSEFIYDAVSAGAIAVITDIYDPFLKNVTQVIHPNPEDVEADIASNYYENPSKNLFVVGITGTNGKTTTSYLIKHILDHFDLFSGLVGGVENITGKNSSTSSHFTTPDVLSSHKLLREMVNQNCQAAVMEVTSHGLAQNRVKNIEFDVALFTNLASDHIDYHKTWEAYAAEKEKLFTSLKSGKKKNEKLAIINIDDPHAETLIKKTPCKTFTYGIDQNTTALEKEKNSADLLASNVEYSIKGTKFTLHYDGKTYLAFSSLVGEYNLYNMLGAISVGISKGFAVEQIITAVKSFCGVPGRLERIDMKRDFYVFVDFAHTEDGLLKVLSSLKKIHTGKIITVFGCGGDRDFSKRKKMGQVSEKFSDFSIITTDNPRKEEPEKITKDIQEGFSFSEKHRVILDRKQAINAAFQFAQKGDLVLIAGKGHEQNQIFATKTVLFNDKEVALSLK